MGLMSKTAQFFGLGKAQPVATKAVDTTAAKDAFSEIFGGNTSGPSFSTFNGMRSQLLSYHDWVYAAASRVAEEAACIDIELYQNNTKQKSTSMGRKIAGNTKNLAKYRKLRAQNHSIVTRDGKVVVMRAGTPALEEIEDSPLMDLLDRPNKFMSGDEFFELTFLHLELTGNAFWAIMRGKGKQPAELWPLFPNYMRIVEDSKDFIKGYIYNVNGEQVPFEPEDIIHHKYSNPNDLRWGMSTVQAAARVIDTDTMAADYNRKFFYNSAQPDAVLYTEEMIDDKTWLRIKDQFQDMYGGTANAHKTAILENGLKYQAMNPNQRDMEFLASRNFNRDMILAMFGVPKSILGMDASMSRANAETAEYVFTKGTIKPKMARLVSNIQEKLAPQFADNIVVNFADPVPMDKLYKLQEHKQLANLVLTANEVREDMGYEPIADGDKLYVLGSMVPIGTPTQTPTTPEAAPQAEATEDEDMHSEDGGESGTGPEDETGASAGGEAAGGAEGGAEATKAIHALSSKKKDSNDVTPTQYLDKRNEIADKYEPQVFKGVVAHMKDQEKEVLANVGKRFKALSTAKSKRVVKANLENLFDPSASEEGWLARLSIVFENIISAMGLISIQQLEEALGEDVPPYEIDPSVKQFYEDRIRRISVYFDQETQKQLAATLREGVDAGESVDELRKRVKTLYAAGQEGDLMWYRAERIGRTEPIFATTWTTIDSWKKSGLVIGKRWHTAPGAVPAENNPCGFCRNMNGKVVELDGNYFDVGDSMTYTDDNGNDQTMKLNYVDTIGPPLHPNCRCTLLPILQGESLE